MRGLATKGGKGGGGLSPICTFLFLVQNSGFITGHFKKLYRERESVLFVYILTVSKNKPSINNETVGRAINSLSN